MTSSRLLDHLSIGRDRAVSLSELAERLNLPRRVIEEAVQQARLEGHPICTGNEGTWIAADAADLEETYLRLRGRVTSQSVTAWAVRRTLRRMRYGEQTTLGLVA